MNKSVFIIMTFVLLTGLNGFAVLGETDNQCNAVPTQQAMLLCTGDEYKKNDAALNRHYRAIMQGLNEPHKKSLRTAQRAWLKYRDAHCYAVRERYQGGSMMSLTEVVCLNSLTRERINVLTIDYQ